MIYQRHPVFVSVEKFLYCKSCLTLCYLNLKVSLESLFFRGVCMCVCVYGPFVVEGREECICCQPKA